MPSFSIDRHCDRDKMVTRKPFGPPVDTAPPPPTTGNHAIPPYPTTPTSEPNETPALLTHLDRNKTLHSAKSVYSPDLTRSPAFDLIDMTDARQQRRQRRDSDVESRESWENSDEEREEAEADEDADADADADGVGDGDVDGDGDAVVVPKPLSVRKSYQHIGGAPADGKKDAEPGLPTALIPGGMHAARKSTEEWRYEDEANGNPWAGVQSDGAGGATNNPYRQPPQQNGYAAYQPSGAVPERKPVPPAAPPPQPVGAPPRPPTAAAPAPPAELPTGPKTPADELSQLSLGEQRPQRKPFETTDILALPGQRQASLAEADGQQAHEFLSNNPWKAPSPAPPGNGASAASEPAPSAPQQYAPPPGPPPKAAAAAPLIAHEPAPPQRPHTEAPRPIPEPIDTSAAAAAAAAALEPRGEAQPVPETPNTIAGRQRSEHYSIKHINWLDGQTHQLRQSPILTQNANGPCPLLALVNALVLTTPQTLETALVETLRTREQISLGLLLDAVFDELMSGRRMSEAGELPDVGELYTFLLALHTGMNVNPRLTLQSGSGAIAGTFEQTKEMQLYSAFSIPLIHGWIAPADTPAGMAMQRNAPTFEEAQNIQFLESELEDKKGAEGLSREEDQVLQDIRTVNQFLSTWPTQLTDFGLEEISKGMKAGQTAILFRNDHFSTLYKEPRHGALMTLVTDAGYGGHDEVVWESLVDVAGSASEMFSGDFRVVSHGQDATRLNQGNSGGGEEGWTTVQGRRPQRQGAAVSQTQQQSEEVPPPLPGPRPAAAATVSTGDEDLGRHTRSASEQEDHDLALALQLQEEEEANEREVAERRRRETRLSEQYLSSQSQNTGNDPEGPRPPIPPRRSRFSRSGGPTGRPGVHRPAEQGQGGSPPPPTYEQSANDRMYRPAGATAAQGLEQGNPLSAYDALRRQQSGVLPGAQSSTSVNTMGTVGNGGGRQGNRIRRRSSQMNPPGGYGPGGAGVAGGSQQGVNGNGRVGQAAGVKDAEDKCAVM